MFVTVTSQDEGQTAQVRADAVRFVHSLGSAFELSVAGHRMATKPRRAAVGDASAFVAELERLGVTLVRVNDELWVNPILITTVRLGGDELLFGFGDDVYTDVTIPEDDLEGSAKGIVSRCNDAGANLVAADPDCWLNIGLVTLIESIPDDDVAHVHVRFDRTTDVVWQVDADEAATETSRLIELVSAGSR